MTAIAAVIALSSTPSLAQSVDTPAPIVESTPAPAPAAPDPLAPAPTVTDTSTAEPVAAETTAAPVAPAKKTPRAIKPAARAITTRTTATRNSAAARTIAATPVTAPVPTPAPLAAEPVPIDATPIAAPPLAEPAPAAADAPVVANGLTVDEALPIAGAGALGLLALAGVGFALRRRRRQDDAIHEAKWQQIEAAPESAFEPEPVPTFVRTSQADAAPVAAAEASSLPDGFDVSRFGPHVRAAYAGPTEDNPSLSLKRRLSVGHFLDKQEAETATAAPSQSAEAQPAKPAFASVERDFMFRRDEKKPALRPVSQH